MAQSPFPSGIGTPPPIGGSPAPKMPPAGAEPPDSDDTGGPAVVRPDAVHYHEDAQSCSTCEYMGEGGQCAILQMQVKPEGGCSAYESKNEGGEAPEGADMGGDMGDMGGAGSSGEYPQ